MLFISLLSNAMKYLINIEWWVQYDNVKLTKNRIIVSFLIFA